MLNCDPEKSRFEGICQRSNPDPVGLSRQSLYSGEHCEHWAHLDTATTGDCPSPRPTTKEWGEGQGEGPRRNVPTGRTNPSPHSCLAGRGSCERGELVAVSRSSLPG